MVLIMVDDEGDGCASTKEERRQFTLNHRKWIDIAHYLGCHAIRTNCRGMDQTSKKKHCNALLNLIIFAGICCWFKYKSAYRKSWWTFQRPRLDGCPYERS